MPASKRKKRGFDPEGSDYDYTRAKAAGMGRGADGHWGSVAPANASQRQRFKLPEDSYVVLKGRSHPTFDLTVKAEERRGSEIVKKGARYYSVPTRNR
jgi:hypothetical protein